MVKRFGVLIAVLVAGYVGSPSATAQIQPKGGLPGATGPVSPRPGMQPQPKVAPGVYGLPTVTTGQGPLAGKGPLLPPGTVAIPGTFGSVPVGPPPVAPPPVAPPPAAGANPAVPQNKIILDLTNGGQHNMTVHIKYVNADGQVRVLNADAPPTIAPGQKRAFGFTTDIATLKENGETKYMISIRIQREGFADSWWGVKGENGKVEDKNEFTGIRLTATPKQYASGRIIKTLSMTLRPKVN